MSDATDRPREFVADVPVSAQRAVPASDDPPVSRELHIPVTALTEEEWRDAADRIGRLAINLHGRVAVGPITMSDDRWPLFCGRVHRITGKRCQERPGHGGCQGEPEQGELGRGESE